MKVRCRPIENRIGVKIASTIGVGIQMLTTFQITIEILVGTFFLVAAIACLMWPDKFYEHALRPVCRKADIKDKQLQNMQKRGYVWNVRIIGVIAAVMFTFTVIHLLSSMPNGHRGMDKPIPSVPNQAE